MAMFTNHVLLTYGVASIQIPKPQKYMTFTNMKSLNTVGLIILL